VLWELSDKTGSTSIFATAWGLGDMGARYGALGGFLAGLVAALCRTRAGWQMAVVLGGLPSAFPVALAICVPETRLAGLFAGSLLAAVCHGLLAGRSRLPGIQQLATLANATHAPRQRVRTNSAANEPTPAASPRGRGDEPGPFRLPSREERS
jgi:hypothetical protein